MVFSRTSLLQFTYFLFHCGTKADELRASTSANLSDWRRSLLSPCQLLERPDALVTEVDMLSNLSAEVRQVADDAWQVGRDVLCLTLVQVELWHVGLPSRIVERDVEVLLGALVL